MLRNTGLRFGARSRSALNGLSNVDVRVSREDTGESRTVKTDDAGRFSVPELPPAVYRVNVEQPGYGPFVVRTEFTMNQEVWLRFRFSSAR